MFDDRNLNKNEFAALVSFAADFHVLHATGTVWILSFSDMYVDITRNLFHLYCAGTF